MFRQFCSYEPVFVVIDVRANIQGFPTTAYQAVEEIDSSTKEVQKVFKHIPCAIAADESEEVSYYFISFYKMKMIYAEGRS